MEERGAILDDALATMRGVEFDERCPDCGGWGRKAYSDTTTWHGGAGGQAITGDVCDKCWGSGNRFRPGTDLRKVMHMYRAFKRAIVESDYCYACDCHPSSGHAKACVMA